MIFLGKKICAALFVLFALVGGFGLRTSEAYSFERDLGYGDSGADVSMLQEILRELGLFTTTVSGFFGNVTQESVQAYQSLRNVVLSGTPDTTGYGRVGPSTRASLMAEGTQAVAAPAPAASPVPQSGSVFVRDLSYGSQGTDVTALQKFLNASGFAVAQTGPGSAGYETDRFFAATRDALMRFQLAQGISPASGYFGPLTRTRILGLVGQDSAEQEDEDDTQEEPAKKIFRRPEGPRHTSEDDDDEPVDVTDTAGPSITNITYDTVASEVTIEWTTDEPATSAVDYGTSASYGSTEDSATLTTSHSIEIDGLSEGTTYYVRIRSSDAASNESAVEDTFVSEDYFEISSIPGLVAFWDFSEDSGEDRVAKAGTGEYPLSEALSPVSVVNDGPFSGRSISLSGSNYLKLLSEDTGDLHIGPRSDEVTVVAWTKVTSGKFVAGMWKEANGDPRREYGLFYNLDTYGCSNNRVCGHISKTGDKSPGLPYSRDLSKSHITMATSTWNMIGMTYDGSEIISWHDGWWSEYTTYTEPIAPNGDGRTYPANPYAFADGLYESTPSDFTVGANEVTVGMQNFFTGQIGGLAVYDRRLTDAEMVQLRRVGAPSEPVYSFDFTSDYTGNYFMAIYGWRSAQGPTAINMSGNNADTSLRLSELSGFRYMNRGATTTPSLGYVDTLGGLDTDELDSITFKLNNALNTDQVRVALKIDSDWYVTNQTYSVTTSGYTGSNWTTAETKTLNFDPAAANWRDLTFTPGSVLSLATTTRSTDLPDGELTGLGIYTGSNTATLRLDDIKVFAD